MVEKQCHLGQLLSRREAMAFLGVTSAVWLFGGKRALVQAATSTSKPICILRPEQTEGPYFIDERLHRSDIRSDPSTAQITGGTALTLLFQVSRIHANKCHPLPDAQVDIWHCDARGVYSDVEDSGFNTIGQQFLRGYQVTDAQGCVRFITIYPGWYPIRTVHIHFKVRTAPSARRSFEFTSQIYFPDELTDRVHTGPPYSSRGIRRVKNRHDFIFRQGGEQLVIEPSTMGDGFTATFPIGLTLP